MSRCVLFVIAVLTVPSMLIAAESKPNIVFLLVDDLGYADCGFNGGKVTQTPQMDRLAKAGAVLESHYVQPVCSPTRAALMTGRYATRTGVYQVVRPKAKWGLPLNERTLANALHDAGYETAITGKWHLGDFEPAYLPTARGFDHQYGHYFGAIDYFDHTRDGMDDWYRDDKPLKEEGYSTHLVAKEACRLIAERNKSKPLFLYVPFNGIHAPHQVPDKYLEPYSSLTGAKQKLAGMLAAVDEAVGQIVAALETTGMRENTLIVFSSDNGGPSQTDNTPLKGIKGSIDEGGVRGCAFANWPGHIPGGVRIKEPVHIIDWYPTFIKLAGGSLEQKLPIDGKDIWPVLTEGAHSPHESILCVKSPTSAAVRMGDWKLVINDGPDDDNATAKSKKKKAKAAVKGPALYNLATDISEEQNLADKEPNRVIAMRAKLQQWLKDAVPSGAKP